jgi:GNAT superfamily N-acetyltransferase
MAAGIDPRLLALNVFESVREFARWQDACMCIEEDGILLVAGASESPLGYANCALRIDPAVDAKLVLERAATFFAGQERGFTLWVRAGADEDLEAAALGQELRAVSESPWMVLETALPECAPADGLEVRRVTSADGVRDAAEVNADAYQSLAFSAEDVRAIYARPERALEPNVAIFVGYAAGVPVSTAMALQTAGVGGVYWVGTRETGRTKGFAAACTRAAVNHAFLAGARVVTLQATRMGESLYRRLGFRTVSAHRWLMAAIARHTSLWVAWFTPLGEAALAL